MRGIQDLVDPLQSVVSDYSAELQSMQKKLLHLNPLLGDINHQLTVPGGRTQQTKEEQQNRRIVTKTQKRYQLPTTRENRNQREQDQPTGA